MGNRKNSGYALRLAIMAFAGLATATLCAAQDNAMHGQVMVRGGQGGYITLPDTTPAPTVYALTGEPSQFSQTAKVWQHEVGPVFSVGNGRLMISGK